MYIVGWKRESLELTPMPGYAVTDQGFLMKVNQDGKIYYEKRFTFEEGFD